MVNTPSSTSDSEIAIIGTGPAGLMAAFELAKAGHPVTLYEKRPGPGRKLLIAGSSGLNITFDAASLEFAASYRESSPQFSRILETFSPSDWIAFIERMGIRTFKGTSRRYFVEGMKASILLKTWVDQLLAMGVRIEYQQECVGFEVTSGGVLLQLQKENVLASRSFKAVCFCLGGGSWEPKETPLRWPSLFKNQGIEFEEFVSSNVGFKVDWPAALLKEAEGLPLKNIVLQSAKGARSGDAVITSYGIEGTPVYFAGVLGNVNLDLKPDLTESQMLQKLENVRENLSPMRRVKKVLQLSPAALALVFHLTPKGEQADARLLVQRIKKFPLLLTERQPLAEAISSSGGISWNEVDLSVERFLMLRRFPGVFLAGEMLNWDAPTGGFLIQGSVSSGHVAARSLSLFVKNSG